MQERNVEAMFHAAYVARVGDDERKRDVPARPAWNREMIGASAAVSGHPFGALETVHVPTGEHRDKRAGTLAATAR